MTHCSLHWNTERSPSEITCPGSTPQFHYTTCTFPSPRHTKVTCPNVISSGPFWFRGHPLRVQGLFPVGAFSWAIKYHYPYRDLWYQFNIKSTRLVLVRNARYLSIPECRHSTISSTSCHSCHCKYNQFLFFVQTKLHNGLWWSVSERTTSRSWTFTASTLSPLSLQVPFTV